MEIGRRPWHCYAKWTRPPYQKKRSRSRRREYVKGGADPKIRMYDMGNKKKPLEEWDLSLGIKVTKRIQISHFALEAIRTSINRNLQKRLTRAQFHLRIRVHPWHVYRENKMMAFAGADRLQSGMRNSFGRPIGTCARVRPNQTVAEVFCDYKAKDVVIKALRTATYKIGCKCRVVILRIKDLDMAPKIGLPLALEKPPLNPGKSEGEEEAERS